MARSGRPGAPSISPAAVGLPGWWNLLSTRADGRPHPLLRNGKLIVDNDVIFSYAIMLNAFSQEMMMMRPLPWDINALTPRPWKDSDDIELAIYFQSFGLHLGSSQASEIVHAVAKDHSFHPVLEYYDRLRWDQVPRLGDQNHHSWLTHYCGAKDDAYVRAIGARWMISAVARVYEPGCQVDSVLILEGRTGLGKSSVFRILGSPWYTSHIASLATDDAAEQLLGKHLIELDELDAMQRASEWGAVLSFVTRPIDHFRLKYGRRSGDFPRQCVFGGTTEKSEWLRDYAGHRRWWPIACGPTIDLTALSNDKDQLWAEAVARYKGNERHWLHEPALIAQAAVETDNRIESDLWEDRVRQHLSTSRTALIPDILRDAIGTPLDRQTEREKKRVVRILRKLHWAKQSNIDPQTGLPSNMWSPAPKDEEPEFEV